ncbi:MAG: Hpt domain-containing protein [Bdellovibrionales bacterium]
MKLSVDFLVPQWNRRSEVLEDLTRGNQVEDMELDDELIAIFFDESSENLEKWERACIELERNASEELYDALFRAAHNLKGGAMAAGLEEYGSYVHTAEDLINLVRAKGGPLFPDVAEVLFDIHSVLTSWLDKLRDDFSYIPDLQPSLTKITSVLSNKFINLKGEDSNTSDNAEEAEADDHKDIGTILIEEEKVTVDQVLDAKREQNRKLGEILVDRGATTEEEVKSALSKQKKQASFIRVSDEKLDALIQLVGELVIHQTVVNHGKQLGLLDKGLYQNSIELATKISKEIQTQSLNLRMQPVKVLFQRLERTIADLGRQLGKNIKTEVIGEHVELDKSVVEKVIDPLIHMVRNAVDHGIETPEERAQTSKPKTAIVRIEAEQSVSGVTIKISDDGKGLDTKKYYQKPLKRES